MKSYDYLISYNIKPSVQRIAIMDYLLAHKTHPSIDEIYLALCKDIPTLSKTTVYNTLKLFVEHGAALMLTIDEKNACFDGDTSLHAHFLCKKCGKIFDLPYSNEVKKVEQIDMNGFKVDEIHQYYKGICPACSKEDTTPRRASSLVRLVAISVIVPLIEVEGTTVGVGSSAGEDSFTGVVFVSFAVLLRTGATKVIRLLNLSLVKLKLLTMLPLLSLIAPKSVTTIPSLATNSL